MIFNSTGYEPEFIQRRACKDESAHLATYIYKFYSPKTKLFYIINADYHEEDFFAIKFYAKQHRRSNNKYSIIINKGDLPNILITCTKVVPMLLQEHPTSSFGFCGSRTIDKKTKRIEDIKENQRFRVYIKFVPNFFGTKTFKHIEYPKVSSYLLVNKKSGKVADKEKAITKMLAATYINMPDIDN